MLRSSLVVVSMYLKVYVDFKTFKTYRSIPRDTKRMLNFY